MSLITSAVQILTLPGIDSLLIFLYFGHSPLFQGWTHPGKEEEESPKPVS